MRFMIIVKTKNFEAGVMPEHPQSIFASTDGRCEITDARR
jgi:hypothetical protein